MRRWLKRLFCSHNWRWKRNIYGDEIIARNYNRSEWFCVYCKAIRFRDYLVIWSGDGSQ